MGFFGGKKRNPRRAPGPIPKRISGKRQEIDNVENWLSHPQEFGCLPDFCEIIRQCDREIIGFGSSKLTLIRYGYKGKNITGRAVDGPMVWSFIGENLNEISDEDYLTAYCGWCFVFIGMNQGNWKHELTNETLTVKGVNIATANEKYILGDKIVFEFSGKDESNFDIMGATDGETVVIVKKMDPKSRLPIIYYYFGALSNPGTYNPGRFTINLENIALFNPYLATGDAEKYPVDAKIFSNFPREKALKFLSDHMNNGDCRAAIVVDIKEHALIVGAYNDDFDACILLESKTDVAKEIIINHKLKIGDKLLTVNRFKRMGVDGKIQGDIIVGELSNNCPWGGVWPIIAEFICENGEIIKEKRASIEDKEWKRVAQLAKAAYVNGAKIRRMDPFFSGDEGIPQNISQ